MGFKIRLQLRYSWLFMLLVAQQSGFAQTVVGTVSSADGERLPFATITLVGAQGGTTASLEGAYSLSLPAGATAIEARYIGYEPLRIAVDAALAETTMNFELEPATYNLGEATVSANAEDPAYRIMREAAARREQYLRADPRYEVDVYVKGQFKIDEAPTKIMGQELGDMGGVLDSSRAGIVYLSETYSTLQFEQPDNIRETVTASKVSGSPRGYSYNSAAVLDFDLYQRTTDYNTPILSPIAENAPSTYRFALLGSRRAENARLVYKIDVTPRNAMSPAYHGTLYIEDSTYHLLDADLYLVGGTLNASGLDTLYLSQSYRQREDAGWQIMQRRLEPVINFMGFRIRGIFAAVYSNFDYNPDWPVSPFGKTRTEILPESNLVDSTLWEARPIPLTSAEQLDYTRKDSIQQRVNSPAYRDSVQAKRNEFDFGALTGYTYSNWRKNTQWTFESPISKNGFHSVTGLQLGVGLKYTKAADEEASRLLTLESALVYGWADEQFYPTARAAYLFSKKYGTELALSGGRALKDYHRFNPVDAFFNAGLSLSRHRNPLKLYESRFVQVEHTTQLKDKENFPLADLNHALIFEQRLPRANETEYSFGKKSRRYTPNFPNGSTGEIDFNDRLQTHTILRYFGGLSFTPGRQFLVRPDSYTALPSKWPTLGFNWRYGFEIDNPFSTRIGYLFVGASVRKEEIQVRRLGKFSARVATGANVFFAGTQFTIDLDQFAGSELLINNYSDYLTRFLALPHYGLTTDQPWVNGVVEHNFNGLLWRQLPVLRRLGWNVIIRAAGIAIADDEREHYELGAALSNIGFGPARFFRADIAVGNQDDRLDWRNPVYRIGFNVPLNELVIE